MQGHQHAEDVKAPSPFTDPKNLRILVIDSKGASRQTVCQLLRECSYQVSGVKTAREGLQLLQDAETDGGFDLILKEHEPPSANACRLLKRLAKTHGLRRGPPPVVIMSSQDEREVVMSCLTLGAIDYLIKPLRQNELRHIWTRVWWWRKSQVQGHTAAATIVVHSRHRGNSYEATSSDSKETKCACPGCFDAPCSQEEEEPTSKEGSAPDANGNGHGSNGNGSNGSKEGNGTSRVDAKPHGDAKDLGGHGSNGNNGHGSNNGNGSNGSSDNKNGNGNSATKGNGNHNGSSGNGNGASTTLAVDRNHQALVNTAEGKMPPNMLLSQDSLPGAKGAGTGRSSAFDKYMGPSSSSRKRPASDTMPTSLEDGSGQQPTAEGGALLGSLPQQAGPSGRTSKLGVHRDRAGQLRSSAAQSAQQSQPGSGSGHAVREEAGHSGHPGGMGARASSGPTVGVSGGQGVTHSGSYSKQAAAAASGGSLERQGSQGVSPSHFTALHSHQQHQASVMGRALQAAAAATGWPPAGLQGSHQHVASLAASGLAAPAGGLPPGAFPGLYPPPAAFAGIHAQLLTQLAAQQQQGLRFPVPVASAVASAAGAVGPGLPVGGGKGVPHHTLEQLQAMLGFATQEQLQQLVMTAELPHGSRSLHGHGAPSSHSMQQQNAGIPTPEPPPPGASGATSHHAMYLNYLNANPVALQAMFSQPPAGPHPHSMQHAGLPGMTHQQQPGVAGVGGPHGAVGHPVGVGAWRPPPQQQLHPAAAVAAAAVAAAAAMYPTPPGNGNGHNGDLSVAAGNSMMLAGVAGPGGNPLLGVTRSAVRLHVLGMPEPKRRRALALDKYRKKRNNLKFSKTIRYETRKQLAHQRPRVRGQFRSKNSNGDEAPTGSAGTKSGNAAGGPEEEEELLDAGEEEVQTAGPGYWEEEDYDNDVDGGEDTESADNEDEDEDLRSDQDMDDHAQYSKGQIPITPDAEPALLGAAAGASVADGAPPCSAGGPPLLRHSEPATADCDKDEVQGPAIRIQSLVEASHKGPSGSGCRMAGPGMSSRGGVELDRSERDDALNLGAIGGCPMGPTVPSSASDGNGGSGTTGPGASAGGTGHSGRSLAAGHGGGHMLRMGGVEVVEEDEAAVVHSLMGLREAAVAMRSRPLAEMRDAEPLLKELKSGQQSVGSHGSHGRDRDRHSHGHSLGSQGHSHSHSRGHSRGHTSHSRSMSLNRQTTSLGDNPAHAQPSTAPGAGPGGALPGTGRQQGSTAGGPHATLSHQTSRDRELRDRDLSMVGALPGTGGIGGGPSDARGLSVGGPHGAIGAPAAGVGRAAAVHTSDRELRDRDREMRDHRERDREARERDLAGRDRERDRERDGLCAKGGNATNDANGGKNGSDSGSNSPDENGGTGRAKGGDMLHSSGHKSSGHGHGHR